MTNKLDSLRGNWNYPTRVLFGVGRIEELPDACREAGIARPLLVTDRGLAGTWMVQKSLDINKAAGMATGLFTDVQPNPLWPNVQAGLAAYNEGGHDGVIAFGGGSSLDVGKSIAFMLPQIRPIWDFEDIGDLFKRAETRGIAPIVAVPTTAGTGSEVGRGAVITDPETHVKRIIFHPQMLPRVAILDAELTMGMSPRMTAGTGLDALAHNIEAYCSPLFHPMADGVGIEGVRLVKEWLAVACEDENNVTARSYMLPAAAMGATAFQKGLGAVHSLSHPVGALFDTHHGLTNGVLLPYVLQFNRPAIEQRISRLAAFLGLPHASFDSFMEWVLELRTQLGTPHTLKELDVTEESLKAMSEMAAHDPTAPTNPVPATDRDMLTMYRKAFLGHIDS